MNIAFVEANHDRETASVHAARKIALDTVISENGNTVVRLFGALANPDELRKAWKGISGYFGLIRGMGHGSNNTFTGQNEVVIFGNLGTADHTAQAAIVHLYSCNCGNGLGKHLMANNAKAFVGYGDRVLLPSTDTLSQLFVRESTSIDKAIVAGNSSGQVKSIAEQNYVRARAELENHPDSTFDDLAWLESNHSALVGPWNTPAFGAF